MERRKLLYTVLGLLALIFGAFALMKQWEVKVSCVPNEERTAIRLIAQNAQIDAITLKYDDGFLQLKQETGELSIRGCGTEYVRIDYLDRSGTIRILRSTLRRIPSSSRGSMLRG